MPEYDTDTDAEEQDPFAFESGLLDDFDGTITSASFGTNPRYTDKNGTPVWYLSVDILPDGKDVEFNTRYNLGPGWHSVDGGATAEHPDPKKKTFGESSQVARFVQAALDSGAANEIRKRATKLGPKKADLLEGFNFHFNLVGKDYTIPADAEAGTEEKKGKSQRLFPKKFNHVVELPGKEAPKPVETTTLEGSGHKITVPVDLATKVKTLAKVKDHDKWVEAVLELGGSVYDVPGLTDAIVSTEFYEAVKAS